MKNGNCECIATWGRPTPRRQSFSALRRHAKFEVAETIHCHIGNLSIGVFLLMMHYFTPWPWPLTLNICSVSPVTCWNSLPNLNTIQQSAADYCDFNIWHDLFLRVARASGIIFTKFDFRQLLCAWIIAFIECWYVISRCDLDLWPVDLESSWYIKRTVSVIKVLRNLREMKSSNPPAELLYVTLSPWPLTTPPPGGPRSAAKFFKTLFWRLNVQWA